MKFLLNAIGTLLCVPLALVALATAANIAYFTFTSKWLSQVEFGMAVASWAGSCVCAVVAFGSFGLAGDRK